jgi:pSer/pThr/pTyr-binding forkhead associated (FHA) protein
MDAAAAPNITPPPRGTTSAQSTVSDGSTNNTTLVGVADTNSTLVAGGGGSAGHSQQQQLVPIILLQSDNKKIIIERPVIGILSIGRYVGSQAQTENTITFKSKVISRHHAEIWTVNGEVYVRDSRSQSGTFLNAMRLSEPSRESKPYRLKPGDVLQFGVDYKGATEGKFIIN